MNEITNVENFFKSHQVHLSRIWLESCINWCKEENLPPNYTLSDLQFNVFEQWLLLDLREVEISCLPPNLLSKEKYILKDNYTLQLMQIVDISKPKYWQLQRIRNGIPKNLEQEFESSKRALQLTLTDGVQEVQAMEYKPIKCLNLNLSPGIKIRLMGPIQVRRGTLMLEERHVKVIGGEVDSLLISNAAENILAKHLNQPLNPKPEVIQETILSVNKDMFNETGGSSVTSFNNNAQNNFRNNLPNQNQNNVNATCSTSGSINQNNQRKVSNSTPKNKAPTRFENPDDFDDFQIDQEIEILMEIEREFEQPNTSIKKRNKTPDMFDDTDIDFESIDIPNTVKPSNSKTLPEPVFNDTLNVINVSDSLEVGNFISPHLSSENTKQHTPTVEGLFISSPPVIWPIDKLVKTMPKITNGKFKIRAKFKKIVEKMTVIENSFHLVVEVEDASGEIPLKFHCDIVTELIGHSVEEFMRHREEWSKNNVQAKTKILGALECLKNRLTDLDNVLEVLVNAKETFPILLKIL